MNNLENKSYKELINLIITCKENGTINENYSAIVNQLSDNNDKLKNISYDEIKQRKNAAKFAGNYQLFQQYDSIEKEKRIYEENIEIIRSLIADNSLESTLTDNTYRKISNKGKINKRKINKRNFKRVLIAGSLVAALVAGYKIYKSFNKGDEGKDTGKSADVVSEISEKESYYAELEFGHKVHKSFDKGDKGKDTGKSADVVSEINEKESYAEEETEEKNAIVEEKKEENNAIVEEKKEENNDITEEQIILKIDSTSNMYELKILIDILNIDLDNISDNISIALMNACARFYYTDHAKSFTYVQDGTVVPIISEEDIMNITYLLNDREDLLSLESLNDSCNNIENALGYEPTELLSILSSLQNKKYIKETLTAKQFQKWNRNLQRQIDKFQPAQLSDLIIENYNEHEIRNLRLIEKNINMLVNCIKENGKITPEARKKYNNMLLKLHYDNAYNNDTSISNNVDNNSNLGFKYFISAVTYAAYDVGTAINPYTTVIESTKLVDPITGEKFKVRLTTYKKDEIETLNRIASDEHSKKLDAKYTKIKNKLPVLGYKADLCSYRRILEKQVKHNEKLEKSKKKILK